MRPDPAVHHRARFVGPMDRILYLRSLPMIGEMSIERLAVLAEHLEERFTRKGQVVIPLDRPVSHMHFVVSGLVRTTFKGTTIALVAPPYGAGFAAALSRVDEGYEAVAEVDTQTLRLDREVFLNFMEDDFQLMLNAIRLNSRGLLNLRDKLPTGSEHDDYEASSSYTGKPLDLVERLVWMIRNSSVFKNGNIDAVMEICRRQTERRWQDGERIWSVGDRADFGFSILQGKVRCWGADGQREFTAGEGFGLGFLDSFGASVRHVNADAQGEVVGLVDDIGTLIDVFEDNFDLARDLLSAITLSTLEISAQVGLAEK